jgi:hypothetical protein
VPLSRSSLKTLVPSFDIFKTDNDGHLIWCATVATIDDATARAVALAEANQCAYVVFNQKTGKHSTIRPIGSLNGSSHGEVR